MITKISISFSGYTDANLLTIAESILQSMNGNANFPNPLPTIADFAVAVENYSQSLVGAKSLGKLPVALKNERRQQLEALLTKLGLYVMCVADGNQVLLTSSGFTLTKSRSPQILGDPGTITLSNGINAGELNVNLKAVKNARSYVHEITADPQMGDGTWTSVFTSTTKYTFTNLDSGKKYSVRVLAVGNGTQTAYTPVASLYVQ